MSSNTSRFRLASRKVLSDSGEPLLIHEDVFASLSGKACSIVSDGNSGTEIDLHSWNEATVERFVEYAYTGDYCCPDPTPLDTPTVTPGPASEQGVNDDNDDNQNKDGGEDKHDEDQLTTTSPLARPLTPLSQCFHAGPDPELKVSQAETFRMKYFHPAKHDFEDTFLVHAQIYTLARHLEIEALWTLALQRLMRTLINIGTVQPSWSVVSNFADLIKFSYEKTSSSADPLRRIISQFAALNFIALQNEDMKACIKHYGEFASDLMEKVCRRLVVSEASWRDEQRQVSSFMAQLETEKRQASSFKAQLETERRQVSGFKAQLETEKWKLAAQEAKYSTLELSEDKLKKDLANANKTIEEFNERESPPRVRAISSRGRFPRCSTPFGTAPSVTPARSGQY